MERVKTTDADDRLAELRQGLAIDKYDLDNVLIEQPVLFGECSDQFVLAVSRRDKAKLDRDELRAELDLRVRKGMGTDKLPETAIANRVMLDEEMQAAQRHYLNCCKTADRWEALKESYKDRSYALGHLTTLYVAGYFVKASASGAVSPAFEESVAEQNRQAMAKLREARRKK